MTGQSLDPQSSDGQAQDRIDEQEARPTAAAYARESEADTAEQTSAEHAAPADPAGTEPTPSGQDAPRGEPARPVGGEGTEPVEDSELVECPDCHASNHAEAAFCEGCGRDLVTGTASPAPAPEELPATRLQSASPHEVYAEPNRDADDMVLPTEPWEVALDPEDLEARPTVPPPVPPRRDEESSTHDPVANVPPSIAEVQGPRSWVAELWVDAAWYASRETEQPRPDLSEPTIIPLTSTNVVIGRTSVAQGLHPDIDCGHDAGVSVRHAQLTSDGHSWWVEDLDTSNGTYVGVAGAPLPTRPLAAGERVRIDQADRVWLGSWTRLVVRETRAPHA